MGHVKEIEIGFIHIFPSSHPHSQCVNKNPAYGIFYFEHMFDDFYDLYLKNDKNLQGSINWNKNNRLLMMFHDS